MSEISCEEVLREIQHFVDGELGESESLDLAQHLAACGPCLDHADFQRRLKEIVRSKCQSETPSYLVDRIQVALRSDVPPPE